MTDSDLIDFIERTYWRPSGRDRLALASGWGEGPLRAALGAAAGGRPAPDPEHAKGPPVTDAVDHKCLDEIADALETFTVSGVELDEVTREKTGVTFIDVTDGNRYEVTVRVVDRPTGMFGGPDIFAGWDEAEKEQS